MATQPFTLAPGTRVTVDGEDVGAVVYEVVSTAVGTYWQYVHDDCPNEYRYPEGPFSGALTRIAELESKGSPRALSRGATHTAGA